MEKLENQNDTMKIFRTMAKIQAACDALQKDTKGHNYKYADLGQIISMLRPLLAEEDACIVDESLLKNDSIWLKTTVYACDGSFFSVENPMPYESALRQGSSDVQKIGSAITYLRRYNRQSLFNLASEDDDGSSLKFSPKPSAKPKIKSEKDQVLDHLKNLKTFVESKGADPKIIKDYISLHGHTSWETLKITDVISIISEVKKEVELRS